MKIGITAGVGGMQFFRFDSSEREDLKACARDILEQMRPLVASYPALAFKIKEIETAYGV